MKWKVSACIVAIGFAAAANAEITVDVYRVNAKGIGTRVGDLKLEESKYGLVITPELFQLPPGTHGIHVHENGSCAPQMKDGKPVAAGAAGDHFDPEGTKKHDTPWGEGHLGDMPPLYVDGEGRATQPFVVPRLNLELVRGKSIVVHEGGDNFSDQPEPSGGGGERIACAVLRGTGKSD